MNLIPKPHKIKETDGFYYLDNSILNINHKCDYAIYQAVLTLKNELGLSGAKSVKIRRVFCSDGSGFYFSYDDDFSEEYTIEISKTNVTAHGKSEQALFYAIQTLIQIARQSNKQWKCVKIEDKPDFKYRGYYLDVSRGRIPTLPSLKELVDKLAHYKINSLQIYIEHAFEFENYEDIYANKGYLTAEEIIELDEYCKNKYVELVPSLATFGHLYFLLQSEKYSRFCELENYVPQKHVWYERMVHHTIDTSNPESFEIIKEMIKQIMPLFSSNKFNICRDETMDLGKDRSKKIADEKGVGYLYFAFLSNLIEYVRSCGKQVMFWGDIVLQHPEYIEKIPTDVICLHWDYADEPIEENVVKFYENNIDTYMCPSVRGYGRLLPDYNAYKNIAKMCEFGLKYKSSGILNCDWGDCGHACGIETNYPCLVFGAAKSWNVDSIYDYAEFDRSVSKIDYNDNSESIVSLLKEIGDSHGAYTWYCFYKDYFDVKTGDIPSRFLQDEEKIIENYNNATVQTQRLMEKGVNVTMQGVPLLIAFSAVLNKKYGNGKEYIIKPCDLAEQFMEWVEKYAVHWRKNNQEGELSEIVDFITDVSNWLKGL